MKWLMRQKGLTSVLFRSEYEKAYDSISWSFMLYMLFRLGFDSKWNGWIRGCLMSSTSNVSLLINGSPFIRNSIYQKDFDKVSL